MTRSLLRTVQEALIDRYEIVDDVPELIPKDFVLLFL
jgi:hypothetical protein